MWHFYEAISFFSINFCHAVQPSEENLCVPFETKIPNDCISSCSFEFGFVQYELKVSCKTVCGTKEYKEKLKIIKLTSSDSLTVSDQATQQSRCYVTGIIINDVHYFIFIQNV